MSNEEMEILSKKEIITKLTLIDTRGFRCIGLAKTKKYTKEPFGFRNNLNEIYKKFDEKDLLQLLKLKSQL